MTSLFSPTDPTWERLARHEGEPCATVILPLSRRDLAGDQLRLRIRRALEQADNGLEARGVEPEGRRRILEPLVAQRDEAPRLPGEGRTLLALLSPSVSQVLLLDAVLPERVVVSERFVLSELLAVLREPRSWYVIGVSDGGARLIHVDGGTPSEASLPLARDSRAAANAERQLPNPSGDRHANRHSANPVGGTPGANSQLFGTEDTDRIERQVWYDVIHQGLRDAELGEDPVVLVADPVHQAGFRERARGVALLDDGVNHAPATLTPTELADLARPLVEPLAQPDLEQVRRRWHQARQEGRTEVGVEAAREAARQGRTQAVLWVPDADRGPDAEPVSLALDEVVRQTVLHGGEVIPLPPGDLPAPGADQAPNRVNAILRWAG